VTDDLSVLSDRIRVLLSREHEGTAHDSTAVEHTLTDGYAHALALEGERKQTEARIHALAGHEEHGAELRALKSRLTSIDTDLRQLRDLLKVLSATL
jgi:hypothetical protein